MAVDLTSLPDWAVGIVALATVITSLLARTRVARLIERWGRDRTLVKIAREQRKMASLELGPDSELWHSAACGSELVIRRRASSGAPETEQGD